MIEKLKPTLKGFDDKPQMPTATEFLDKINEIIDVINKSQGLQTKKETFVCPEQYKWIGKLCKFWDYANKPVYGILDDVDVDNKEYPYTKLGGNIYQNCEPVKPDADIIYKGE